MSMSRIFCLGRGSCLSRPDCEELTSIKNPQLSALRHVASGCSKERLGSSSVVSGQPWDISRPPSGIRVTRVQGSPPEWTAYFPHTRGYTMEKNKNKTQTREEDLLTRAQSTLLGVRSRCESEGEESDCSIMSMSSQASSGSGAPRKRRITAAAESVQPKRKVVAGEGSFTVPSVPTPRTRAKVAEPKPEELSKEMRVQPSANLAARILESLAAVENVSDKAKNLKGDFVRSLREAVRTAQAATIELSQRSTNERFEHENATLRDEVAALNTKVDRLVSELVQSNRALKAASEAGPSHSAHYTTVEQVQAIVDGKMKDLLGQTHTEGVVRPPLGQKVKAGSNSHGAAKMKKVKSDPPVVALPVLPSAPLIEQPRQVSSAEKSTWSKVVGRKAKAKAISKNVEPAAKQTQVQKPKGTKTTKLKPPRIPKTAAIGITIPEGVQITYAEAMMAAKSRIKLSEIGITNVRQKKAVNGGLLLEVEGSDSSAKADQLADKLQLVLSEKGVRVTRPSKTAELRVMDLDESVTLQDVADALALAGSCKAEDVRVGEIRHSPKRLGTAWVRCPLSAAHKVSASGRLQVGWASVRVQVLAARPLQCYRCFETGHTRHQCTSTEDRSADCFVCGQEGHKASNCTASAPKCPLCTGLGRQSDHRMGSKSCNPPKGKKSAGAAKLVSSAAGSPTASNTGTQADKVSASEEAMEA